MTRIISGTARGRRLSTLDGNNTRPTSDRVREALFSAISSWLGTSGDNALSEIAFADLYAGSGAIGLEAASRGAAPVLMVESHRPAATVIRKNLTASRLDADLRVQPVEAATGAAPSQPFDIVWADPPYPEPNAAIEKLLHQLVHNEWLARDALVVVERSSRTDPFTWPQELENAWSRRYGETTLYFAQFDD